MKTMQMKMDFNRVMKNALSSLGGLLANKKNSLLALRSCMKNII